jgi:hypothetical protein
MKYHTGVTVLSSSCHTRAEILTIALIPHNLDVVRHYERKLVIAIDGDSQGLLGFRLGSGLFLSFFA